MFATKLPTFPTAEELGATHLVGLEQVTTDGLSWWNGPKGEPSGHIDGVPYYSPKVSAYYPDGIVHFERGDGKGWDMVPAARITPKMMVGLPAEEQARIRAHATWHRGHTTNL